VACLSNFYLRQEYRSSGLGLKLFNLAMNWLESFTDVNTRFVFVSNGNEEALKFYLDYGIIFNHDVFAGFIQATYKNKGSKLIT